MPLPRADQPARRPQTHRRLHLRGCTSLALISLPDGLTSIGDYAFYECSSLSLTSLPDGLTGIGDDAFNNCAYLTLTILPDGLISIGNYAFVGCASLAPCEKRRASFLSTNS